MFLSCQTFAQSSNTSSSNLQLYITDETISFSTNSAEEKVVQLRLFENGKPISWKKQYNGHSLDTRIHTIGANTGETYSKADNPSAKPDVPLIFKEVGVDGNNFIYDLRIKPYIGNIKTKKLDVLIMLKGVRHLSGRLEVVFKDSHVKAQP